MDHKAYYQRQMKRTLKGLFLCLLMTILMPQSLSSQSHSHDYKNQAQSAGDIDTLSQWRVDNRIDFPPWESVYYCYKHYISGSVIVDSLEYYEVYRSGYSHVDYQNFNYFSNEYSGALREHENKWYKLEYNNDDVLLYDFTMNVGDTVDLATYGSLIIVVDIDTIMVDGEPKKRFHLGGAGWGNGEYIIEDIGATTGLFEPLIFFESESHLHCYAIDFVPLWINPDGFGCDLSVRIKESNNQTKISTYPNPFITSTTIEYELTEPSHVQVTIYNAIGEMVCKPEERIMPQGKHSFTWKAHRLPEGMYYGVLRSEEGVSVVKMVKQ